MARRIWRNLISILLLTAAFWWETSAHAFEPVFLDVEGEITLRAEFLGTFEGHQKIQGRMTDEVGHPVVGSVQILSAGGHTVDLLPCASDLTQNPPQANASTQRPSDANGTFCVLAKTLQETLQVRGAAPHFRSVVREVLKAAPHGLPSLHFTQFPQTLTVGSQDPQVVQLSLGANRATVPLDGRVVLSLKCQDRLLPLDEAPLGGGQGVRFEIIPPSGVRPGLCDLVAQAQAQGYPSVTEVRSVLVSAQVAFGLAEVEITGEQANLAIALTSPGGVVDEGVIEIRENGEFLSSAPVENGQAKLRLKAKLTDFSITAAFLSSNPAWVSGEPTQILIPPGRPGFRAATLHALALIGFCLWLGYAWLRPRRKGTPALNPSPPREAGLKATGAPRGKVTGRVLDAHTGVPLPQVAVSLCAVSAEAETVVEEAETDAEGRFRFHTEFQRFPLLRVSFQAPFHMSLRSELTSSQLTAHLSERRRAAIQNLVRWAKQLGRPWHGSTAPTPEQIARTATARSEPETEAWAHAVSKAAYAPVTPSEQEVTTLRSPSRTRD